MSEGRGGGGGARPEALSPQPRALPSAGGGSAEEKYRVWMRHRYNDCVGWLGELMGHGSFQVKVGEPGAEVPRYRGPVVV